MRSNSNKRYQRSLSALFWKTSVRAGCIPSFSTETYFRRCAISGEKTQSALEVAHIKPYAENGPYLIQNGVLLRFVIWQSLLISVVKLVNGLKNILEMVKFIMNTMGRIFVCYQIKLNNYPLTITLHGIIKMYIWDKSKIWERINKVYKKGMV